MNAATIFPGECECGMGRGAAERGTVAVSGATPATRFTLVVTLAASPERVWRELADVEALPRWAGSFCERVELTRAGWLAWTALGELWVEIEGREHVVEPSREVTLRAGEARGALHAFTLRIAAASDGGTRVTLLEGGEGTEDRARLATAWREALPGLLASTGQVMVGRGGK